MESLIAGATPSPTPKRNRSEDDLLKPMHLNFKWFGFESLPTFMAYDVMKNPEIENDFNRFENHLKANF